MTDKSDVSIPAEGGLSLHAWLFQPGASGPHSADAGFLVLLHEHRAFGRSGGKPRQDIDPWRQVADPRRTISFLEARPEVHPKRAGVWGTSYAGDRAVVLGVTDRRLCAIVSQIPTICGYEQGLRRSPSPSMRGPLSQGSSRFSQAVTSATRNRFSGRLIPHPSPPSCARRTFYDTP